MTGQNYESLSEIQDAAISFCLAVIRNRIGHIGSGKEKLLIEIRDSLIYRTSSVCWHLRKLASQQESVTERLYKEEIYDALNHRQVLANSQYLVSYIFDDVVFNLASMFDYVGNLVGIVYRGPKKSRSKWNGIVKAARDKNSPLCIGSVATLLIESNDKWVAHLLNFRGDNIHHKVELGISEHSLKLDNNQLKLMAQVYMPKSLSKRLLPAQDIETPIVEGAELIAEKSARRCIKILSAVESSLVADYSQW